MVTDPAPMPESLIQFPIRCAWGGAQHNAPAAVVVRVGRSCGHYDPAASAEHPTCSEHRDWQRLLGDVAATPTTCPVCGLHDGAVIASDRTLNEGDLP